MTGFHTGVCAGERGAAFEALHTPSTLALRGTLAGTCRSAARHTLIPLPPVSVAVRRFLLMAQVVLALQLPFVLVPLIKATSSKQLMGPHRNSTLLAAGAWASCGLVFVANLGLFVSELWPGAALVPHVEPDGEEEGGSRGW